MPMVTVLGMKKMNYGQGTYTFAWDQMWVDIKMIEAWTRHFTFAMVTSIGNKIKHGKGIHLASDNMLVDGKMVRSMDKGRTPLPDGDQYVGEFKNDERHGQGTYTFADGRVKHGIWENGKFIEAN